jgi:hypothetical protein
MWTNLARSTKYVEDVKMSLGEIRRAQVISTYGPGSLIPIDDQSFMIAGIDSWFDQGNPDPSLEIRESRLESHLGVDQFVLPPSGESANARDLPVVRFPMFYTCTSCQKLDVHYRIADKDGQCVCGKRLVTSRFITICNAGHVGEFPYSRWVHQGEKTDESHKLTMYNEGRSSGLSDIVIACSCGMKRNMGGALGKSALRGVTKCFGNQPWIVNSVVSECDQQPRAVQRGASNVWQAVTASAISIPPWSSEANKFVDRYWTVFKNTPISALEGTVQGMLEDRPMPFGLEEAMGAIENRRRIANGEPMKLETMRSQEYEALGRTTPENRPDSDFICRKPQESEVIPSGLSLLHLITRLREVRALKSFYRLTSGQDGDVIESPLSGSRKWWLPAIEVSGEGLFLKLDIEKLKTWESHPKVVNRVQLLQKERGDNPLLKEIPATSSRLVLVHTLAHILIDQWSLECGYPAASLRERIYVDENMAGLLIYTATSDSQGSLGGLVGMAKGGRFDVSFREAINRTSWCSNDPLCIESGPNGYESLNLGACHSCVILPETCCEFRNILLDRGLIVGTPDGTPGFFSELIDE